jgi:hypothetical protein
MVPHTLAVPALAGHDRASLDRAVEAAVATLAPANR